MSNNSNNPNRRLSGINPLAYTGVEPRTPPQLTQEKRRPTVNDYYYDIGTIWLVKGTEEVWMLVGKFNPITNAQEANWTLTTSGDLTFHMDDDNDAHPLLGVVNVVGGVNIDTSATVPGGQEIQIALQDNITVAGTVHLGSTPSGVLQTDAAGLIQATNGANGQVLIGGAGQPIWADLTSGDGSVVFTPGPNSLDLSVAPGVGGFGGLIDGVGVTAVPDGAGKVTIANGTMITATAAPANTITVGITDAGAVATPQVVFAPAIGGAAAWGRLATAGGATIGEAGGVITITAGAGGAGGAVILHTDAADAVLDIVDDSMTIVGGNVIQTSGAVNTVTVGLTQGTDGQLILGATGLAPAWGALTSADGNITFTPGANTLDLTLTDPGVDGQVLISSAAGVPIWAGLTAGAGILITPNNNQITITNTGGGGGGGGILVLDCISGTATPDPATPTLVYVEGDANPAIGYNNITTIGTADLVEIKLKEAIALPTTNAGGTAGVIYFDGPVGDPAAVRFIHKMGTNNTFLGSGAGNLALTVGSATGNTAVGRAAMDAVTTGANNTCVGLSSLGAMTTGSSNVAVGQGALDTLTTGSSNVAVGRNALTAATTSSYNTAVGALCLDAVTTGAQNTALGYQSGSALTTGTNSVAVGYQALLTATTSDYNTAIGHSALLNATSAQYNTAVGHRALQAASTGGFNTAVGADAGEALTTSTYNVAIGFQALNKTTTGTYNVAIGASTIRESTTSSQNTAIGYGSMLLSTGSGFNTVVGYEALYQSITGYNTAVGNGVLRNSTTGTANTAVGGRSVTGVDSALYNLTTGTNNVAVGSRSLYQLTTGTGNTAIGYGAGSALTGGEGNNILIDAAGTAGISNRISIGDTQTTCYVRGIYNVALAGTKHPVWIDSTGKLGEGVTGGMVALAASMNSTVSNVSGDDTQFYLGSTAVTVPSYVFTGGGAYQAGGAGSYAQYTIPVTGIYLLAFNIRLNGIQAPFPPPPPPPATAVDPIAIEVRSGAGALLRTWSHFPTLTWNGWQTYTSVAFTVVDTLTAGYLIRWFIQLDYRPGPDFTATGRAKVIGIDGTIGGQKFTYVSVTLLTTQ